MYLYHNMSKLYQNIAILSSESAASLKTYFHKSYEQQPMAMYIKLKQLYIYNRVKHLRWSFSAIFFAKKAPS